MGIDLTDPHRYDDFIRKFTEWDMKFNKAYDLMSRGSLLMQMNKPGDARAWYLVPGGEIDEMVAQDLMKLPNVKPGHDGLFPGISQTWRLKS